MREIKFRDYEPNKKEMRNFDLDTYDRNEHGAWGDIMQFTGLHDRNGKEIYEGDIVDLGEWHGISEVYWNGGYRIHGRMSAISFGNSSAKHCKIIGNIYEKPELTK